MNPVCRGEGVGGMRREELSAHLGGISIQPKNECLTRGISDSAMEGREDTHTAHSCPTNHRLTCEHSTPVAPPRGPGDTPPSAGQPPGYEM